MGQCFLYGNGGGSGLKLRIFDGTSAPSNPKDNDIWIKTSTAIEYWELSDKTFPISWAMGKGFVYIKGDFAGAYDYRETTGLALDVPGNHDGEMYARLTSCVQYDGSTWANKDAYIYHDGWHQFAYAWNGELFDNGNQYVSKTGGWQTAGGTQTSASPYLLVSDSVNNAVVGTANKIDISNYSTLHFIGQGRGDYSNGSAKIGAFGIASSYDATYAHFVSQAEIPNGYANSSTMPSLTTEKAIDISGLSGEYYIAAYVNNPGSGVSLGIKKVWLT